MTSTNAQRKPLPVDCNGAIEEIWSDLGSEADALTPPACRPIADDAVPEPFAPLLVHQQHMTATLARYYDLPMRLSVIASHQDAQRYTRLVRLAPRGSCTAVEHAIITVHLDRLPMIAVRDVLAGERPLGEILLRYAIHTRVAPRWFVEVTPQANLRLATDNTPAQWPAMPSTPLYGRVGRIFCDGVPTASMLEIVTGVHLSDLESEEPANPISQ